MSQLLLPQLRSDQWQIVKHPAKVKVLAMGRRWGKTILGGSVSLATAARGGRVAWVVPVYRNGRTLWRWAETVVGPLRKARLARTNRSERLIEFNNGGFLGIYSADNEDAIRGEWFHLVIIDEAAMVNETIYTDVLQPTVADVDGDFILISTPKGRNWFWKEWQRGQTDGEQVISFTAPSAANPNPLIQRAAALAAERVSQRTYRQEWLAEFLEHEGVVFRNIKTCLNAPKETTPEQHAGHRLVAGVDWGKLNDYTAISVFCADCRTEVAMDRFYKVDYAFQRKRLQALIEHWHVSHIEAESNAMGEPIIEELHRAGMPVHGFQTTAISKPILIESLALAFERAEASWLDIPAATAELEAYEAQLSKTTGRPTYSSPQGLHDDTVMARALAWRSVTLPGAMLVDYYRRKAEGMKKE